MSLPTSQPDQETGYWGALLAAQVKLIENRSLE